MNHSIRYPVIDIIRGFAILAMVVYHFFFDLNMLGYITQDLNYSMGWNVTRSLILGTFLLVAGFSMALAKRQTLTQRFSRLLLISSCALLLTVVSYFMFPNSWIFFGVLHFIVAASIICWLMMPFKKILIATSILLIGLGTLYQSSVFNQPSLQWLGMMTNKPITEDYVPLLPWLGVMMIGVLIGEWAMTRTCLWPLSCTPSNVLSPAQWLGRHSLAVYMLHQPILLGVLGIFGVLN